jgi:AcrR family transcriptional regulator
MDPARSDGVKRRDAILDAALRCFAKQGVLGTGIEEIRNEAKASPSSVYHLFDGLSGLTLALLERTFDRLFAHLASRVTETKTAKLAVIALVGGHLEWILTHRDEGRFMYQATSLEFEPKAQKTLQARKAEALAPMVNHFARFIEEGTLPAWSPLELDVVLLGPMHEACRRFLAGAPLDVAWMRDTLPELAWRSMSGRSAPTRTGSPTSKRRVAKASV